MPRYFSPITVENLHSMIESKLLNGSRYEIRNKLGKDLKVDFDFENLEEGPDDEVVGYHTLDSGLTFCGFQAGGDWEIPVCFIVYFDGKKLRGYVPTKGNTWNKDTKSAYTANDDFEEEDPNLMLKEIENRIILKHGKN